MNPSDNTKSSSSLTSLTAAQTITFIARTWMGMLDDEGKPQPNLIPGQAFAIKARRPSSLRIEEVRSDPLMQAAIEQVGCCAGNPFDVFVSDGARQCELSTTSHVYTEDIAAPRLDEIQTQHGLPNMLVLDLLFADDPLDGFAPFGEETIGDVAVVVYASEQSQDDERMQYRFYLCGESGLPVRLSALQPGSWDEWVEMIRIDYSDWSFDVALPDATFDTAPPPDSEPEPPPSPWFDPHLTPGMEPAPLDSTDLSGQPISLTQYKGKVVLLDYWATWCHPCRTEMLRVKDLGEQWHSQGLEVIGISLDDEAQRERMLAYLQEKAIPWRQVCDGKGFQSPLATVYQVGAIPFTLLIGRDGRIAAVNAHGEELEEAIRDGLAKQ